MLRTGTSTVTDGRTMTGTDEISCAQLGQDRPGKHCPRLPLPHHSEVSGTISRRPQVILTRPGLGSLCPQGRAQTRGWQHKGFLVTHIDKGLNPDPGPGHE